MRYLIKSREKGYAKGYDYLLFAKKSGDKYCRKLLDTATKSGTDPLKAASKRVVQKQQKQLVISLIIRLWIQLQSFPKKI